MHNWQLGFQEYASDVTQSVGSLTGTIIPLSMNLSSLSCTRGCMAIGNFLGAWIIGLASSLKVMW